jgi:16S rRNA (guanine527-N7)-methyltransferase
VKHLFDVVVYPASFGAPSDKVEQYVGLLLRWNQRINLIAKASEAELRTRHVADSLQLLPLLPFGEKPIADLGSGAGFPGLMMALASNRMVHLIEADRRKAAFLVECAAVLRLTNVTVHAKRVEETRLISLSAVTARAFAPLSKLLDHAASMLSPEGVGLFPKGKEFNSEIEAARRIWQFGYEVFPSATDPHGAILRIRDISRKTVES